MRIEDEDGLGEEVTIEHLLVGRNTQCVQTAASEEALWELLQVGGPFFGQSETLKSQMDQRVAIANPDLFGASRHEVFHGEHDFIRFSNLASRRMLKLLLFVEEPLRTAKDAENLVSIDPRWCLR